MVKVYWVVGLLTLSLMGYAQDQGWSLFSESTSASTLNASTPGGLRPGSGLRAYHK